MRSFFAAAVVAVAATYVAAEEFAERASVPPGYALGKGVCFDTGDCLVGNFDGKHFSPMCVNGKCYTQVDGKTSTKKGSKTTKKGSKTTSDPNAPSGYAKASGSVCFDAFDCIGKGPLGKAKCVQFACYTPVAKRAIAPTPAPEA